ncbi:MAG: hypothetical protein RIF37_09745 [Rhodospirillaceae bacterium]
MKPFLSTRKSATRLLCPIWMVFGLAIPVHAAPLMDENTCRLENMGNTKSSIALSHISSACNFLSQQTASLMSTREQRVFSECVLKYLPGTEGNLNANELVRSCRQMSWDSKLFP